MITTKYQYSIVKFFVFAFLLFSILFSGKTSAQCLIPSGLNSSNIGTTTAKVNWTVTSADSFLVRYYKSGTSSYYYQTVGSASARSATLIWLTPNTTYYWQVRTWCNGGVSGSYQSVPASFTTAYAVVCPLPSGLNTTNVGNISAKLNWTVSSADSFLIRYRVNGSPVYLYKTVSSGSARSYTLNGLSPATTYTWQVRTWCGNGTSGGYQTVPASFTTTSTPVACVTPTSTTTGNITSNTANLSWTQYVTADTFMIRYSEHNTTNYVWIKLPGSQHSYNLQNLLPNTAYDWRVRCICGSSPSQAYSVLNTFTTLSNNCGIADPFYFGSTNITSNSATLSWKAVAGATGYNVRYGVRYSGNWNTVSSTSISKNVTGLMADTWYEFQVQVVCATGAGSWTTSGIFKTLTAVLALTRQPYLQLSTPNGIYVRWRTNNPSDSKVAFGISPSALNSSASSGIQTTEHIIQLTNLTPNTKYYYSVGTIATKLQGDTGNYFYTNPPVGSTNHVRIWGIGDFGVGSSGQVQVRDAYTNYTSSNYTNVWLWMGDNAYSDGTDAEYQSHVFNVYPYQLKKWVVWPTSGNHDLHTSIASNQTGAYFDNFTMPINGQAGGLPSGTEAYYSFNYANIHFVCLESTDAVFRSATGAMATWLNNDLAANTQRWTIVYFHHPPYSKGSHDSDNSSQLVEMRTNIVPILENHKVDLVLSGHSHSYERSMLIRGHFGVESTFVPALMAVNSGSGIYPSSYVKASPTYYGTVYAVCGVSGQLGGTSSGYPHNAMYTSSVSYYGSLVIDVTGDRLDYKFLTSSGAIFDQFTIQKTGTSPPPARMSSYITEPVGSNLEEFIVFPNPAKEEATVQYTLNEVSDISIEVMDISGRIVYRSEDLKDMGEGTHNYIIPLKQVSLGKGTYFVRLITDKGGQTTRMVVN
ncbi:MAG: fibronectin type III domain-containing protein [Bacteroidia bacterium]|nr:fibronectin type III domain-containing protein [Bacteroidia bacterium]